MSRDANTYGTLNAYTVRPTEVQPGDAYGWKVIAVVNEHFWSAFKGLSDWTDEYVMMHGDRLPKEAAEALFPALTESGRKYYV